MREEHESWPISYDDLEEHYERVERRLNAQRYPFEHEPYSRALEVGPLFLPRPRTYQRTEYRRSI